MQPDNTFLLNEHFRLKDLLLMLKGVFTWQARTLFSTRQIGGEAFTVHFETLSFFTNAFSPRYLFVQVLLDLLILHLLSIGQELLLLMLILSIPIMVFVIIMIVMMMMMLVDEIPFVIMFIIEVDFVRIELLIVMAKVKRITQFVILVPEEPSNLTKVNQLILWLSGQQQLLRLLLLPLFLKLQSLLLVVRHRQFNFKCPKRSLSTCIVFNQLFTNYISCGNNIYLFLNRCEINIMLFYLFDELRN